MPPRALWTGAISFGLVNVPVRMYSAVSAHDLHFHYVHEKRRLAASATRRSARRKGKPVPDDEIVKAFEYTKGEYVFMADEDFEAAQSDGYQTIEIRDFVPYEEIDPIFFDKTYYLGPDNGAEQGLLAAAGGDGGVGARGARQVRLPRPPVPRLPARARGRDHARTHALRRRGPTLDELTPDGRKKPDKRELQMAMQLIDGFSGKFEPERYRDTYRDTLCEIIQAKRKGKKVHVEKAAEPEETPDILEALRASLESAQGSRKATPRKRPAARKDSRKSSRAKGKTAPKRR